MWRSIFTSRVVIKLEAKWKIGNGEQISMWNDPWVRGGSDAFIKSPVVAETEQLRVRNLWLPLSNEWNLTW